jgi:hypothetical protein
MTEHISINNVRLAAVLNQMRNIGNTSVLTTEIIEQYMGGFHSNRRVPVADSWNAQFGKYLKAHLQELQIVELEANVRVETNGGTTHASRWGLNVG